jgi:aspartyl-tRNA(Asn)/glutamyl-tRNA(Gln) amidotransferase subunit A
MNLCDLTISEASLLIQSGSLSPVELTRAHLERIERLQPHLNAYITLVADQALKQARIAELEVRDPLTYRGRLHGIPIALKDLYETAGIRTTAGSSFMKDYVPTDDAFVVKRLRDAGAILLGKLNMHEWALGVINDNAHYGPCRNPWDVTRSPGGSSGGSGAALAAGLCMGSLGSDTRGSIRIPAALCGVVGLKPTYGRLSLRGVIPLSWSLDHAGPMARSVEDVALLMDAITAYDADDPGCVNAPLEPFGYEHGLMIDPVFWKVAVLRGPFFETASPEVQAAFESALQTLRAHEVSQFELVDVQFPDMREFWLESRIITAVDAATYHETRLKTAPEGFGPDVRERMLGGLAFSGAEYARARRAQTILTRRLTTILDEYDLIVTSTTPMTAPTLEAGPELDAARLSLSSFTAPFNMAGLPAISIPCGFTPAGLPMGLQLAGKHWAEADVLRAALAYEQVTAWHMQINHRVTMNCGHTQG